MEDYIENDEEGNVFELIAEECYYDDKWREEQEIERREKWKKINMKK